MAAGGTAANVILGPGRIYMAPLGTTEPTAASATLASAWLAIGYTEDGTDLTIEQTNEEIMVAEELDPIRVVMSARKVTLKVRMAEPTLRNLLAALGGGAGGSNSATSMDLPSTLVGIMLVHDSSETPDANNRRCIFRECYPDGSIALNFKKSPDKSLIDTTFKCVLPSGQTSPMTFQKPSSLSVVM